MFRLFPINQVKIEDRIDVILCTIKLFVIFILRESKNRHYEII